MHLMGADVQKEALICKLGTGLFFGRPFSAGLGVS